MAIDYRLGAETLDGDVRRQMAEAFVYSLRNRTALDGVIDQYRVKIDKRSGITGDPDHPDDEEFNTLSGLSGRLCG